MKQTVYRTVTAKRRTARPKARTAAAFNGMLGKLGRAHAALAAARDRR